MATTSDVNSFMSNQIFGQREIITYRSLSRALGVNVANSKRMLHNFYMQYKAQAPDSIHATYLVTYTEVVRAAAPKFQIEEHSQDQCFGENSHDKAAGEELSSVKRVQVLLKETQLHDLLKRHGSVSSIHVYSLEPASTSCLTVLETLQNDVSICDRLTGSRFNRSLTYGTLLNRSAKTSPQPFALPISLSSGRSSWLSSKLAATSSAETQQTSAPTAKDETPLAHKVHESTAAPSTSKSESLMSKAPSLKKESSNFFGRGPKATVTSGHATTGEAATSKPASMAVNLSTSHARSNAEFGRSPELGRPEAPPGTMTSPTSAQRKQHEDPGERERELVLQRMMDDVDNPEPEAAAVSAGELLRTEESGESSQIAQSPATVHVTTSNVHKGKRKIMKKVTIKDEEGYLVTKEEPTWEEISDEDSVQAVNKRPAVSEKAAKLGQGSIMSFFKKK